MHDHEDLFAGSSWNVSGCFRHRMLLIRSRHSILNQERCFRVNEYKHHARCEEDGSRTEKIVLDFSDYGELKRIEQ
jgi:hypothetical protein